MGYALDTETTLDAHGGGIYSRAVTDVFWNMESAFGGWALALAVEAVRAETDSAAPLTSINAIFLAGIDGDTVFVRAETLSQRKRTGFFRVTLHKDAADGPLLFSADIVMSERRETDLDYTVQRPDVRPATEVDRLAFPAGMGPRWFGHYDQRIAVGTPFTVQKRPCSAVWMRDGDGRPLDTKGLVSISDVPMPRAFFLANAPRFSSTVSYSFSMFATEAELAEIGDSHILVESDSDRIRRGMSDQRARIWSPSGELIALTSQIAFFR
ncbi:MAG: thioesterase family protein [Pseudomonadota bacterium]